IPTLCGGAAINSNYINRMAKADYVYRAGVFYCKTAFDGLNIMNKLRSPQRDKFIQEWNNKINQFEEKKIVEIKTNIDTIVSKVKPINPPMVPHVRSEEHTSELQSRSE